MRFYGELLGFKYDIDLKSEDDFRIWLKDKILRYVFNMKEGTDMKTTKQTDSIELQVVKEILQGAIDLV